MVHQLPTLRDLLKGQNQLPENLRQNIVRIDFIEPIDARGVNEFHRIGLREQHLQRGEHDKGEDTFYMAEVFQPHRAGVKHCPACNGINRQRSETVSICENAQCSLFSRPNQDGPLRGVVQILIPSDFLIEGDMIPAVNRKGQVIGQRRRRLTRGALLVLDRRYPQEVLAAVFRSAKELAELHGWKTKG